MGIELLQGYQSVSVRVVLTARKGNWGKGTWASYPVDIGPSSGNTALSDKGKAYSLSAVQPVPSPIGTKWILAPGFYVDGMTAGPEVDANAEYLFLFQLPVDERIVAIKFWEFPQIRLR